MLYMVTWIPQYTPFMLAYILAPWILWECILHMEIEYPSHKKMILGKMTKYFRPVPGYNMQE